MVAPANKGRKLPPELLTPEEVRALLGACSTTAPTGIRNRALVVVLYRAGLRLDEALALIPADVDVADGVIHVGRRTRGLGGVPPTTAARAASDSDRLWVSKRSATELTRLITSSATPRSTET